MEEPILNDARLQRIGAEQHRRERARHDLEPGVAVHHPARLAETERARIAPDSDPGAATPAFTPAHVKRLDARDLHRLPPRATIVSCGGVDRLCAYRSRRQGWPSDGW